MTATLFKRPAPRFLPGVYKMACAKAEAAP